MSAPAGLALECREHAWRVVGFDFRARVLTERCSLCGSERERLAPISRDNNRHYREEKS